MERTERRRKKSNSTDFFLHFVIVEKNEQSHDFFKQENTNMDKTIGSDERYDILRQSYDERIEMEGTGRIDDHVDGTI